MTNPLTHLEEAAQRIRLTSDERLRMREHLERHMLEHPLAPVASPYQRYFRVPAFIFAILFLVVSGGGVIAAKGALPGQPLYGLKVNVIEPLEGSLKLTPASRAEWQVRLARTRLMEAEDLQASGAVSTSTAADLSARFARSATRAATEVGALASTSPKKARKAAHNLDTSFSDYEHTVKFLSSTGDASTTPVYSALLTQDDEEKPSAGAPSPHAVGAAGSSPRASQKDENKKSDEYDHARKLFTRVHMLAGENEKRTGNKDK